MSWSFPGTGNLSGTRNQNQNGTSNQGLGIQNKIGGGGNKRQNFGNPNFGKGGNMFGGGGNMFGGSGGNTGRKNNFIQKQFQYHPHNLNPERLHELKGPTDTISDIVWSKNFIACSSWDKCVYVWKIDMQKNSFRNRSVYKDTLRLPVMSCLLVNEIILTGDIGGNIDVINIQKKAKQKFGKHMENPKTKRAAITSIKKMNQNTIFTSSWNTRCKIWDLRSRKSKVINCPERVYCADVCHHSIAVLCGWKNQHLLMYDPRNLSKPMKSLPILKRSGTDDAIDHPGRNIAICSDYVIIGSVGGRLAVFGLNDKMKGKNGKSIFHSKACCEGKPNNVKPFRFPVNGVAVNKKNGYAGVVGSNGHFQIFDLYQRKRDTFNKKRISCSLTKCKFDDSGNIFAFGVSYDFSRGTSSGLYNNKTHQRILLRKI